MRTLITCTATLAVFVVIWARPTIAGEPPKTGTLVIVGGGSMPDKLRERFMALAGGKTAKLVVVPTASGAADRKAEEEGYLQPWRKYGPASLTLLHTRSREKSNDPAFARPITEATAVWFSGGDQTMLIAPYLGTIVETELRSLLKRGGVIGGTSAGRPSCPRS